MWRPSRRSLLMGSAAVSCLLMSKTSEAGWTSFQDSNNSNSTIISGQFLPIGGVGLSRGIQIASDGTMYVYNDSTGAWKANTSATPGINGVKWSAVFNASNAPSSWQQAASPYLGWAAATYEIACSPTNSNFVYLMYSAFAGSQLANLFLSTDGGATWSLTTYPTNSANGNGPGAGVRSQTICIDPNNTNIAWVSDGTQLRVTTDGGSTWTAVNPSGSAGAAFAMCYDTTSGTTGGSTNRLIVGIQGSGIYTTTTAYNGTSATWTLVAGSTTNPGQGRIGSDGTYYCSDSSTTSDLYRLTTGNVWSTIFTSGFFAFAVDPNNPARVFIVHDGGGLYMCTSAANSGSPGWTTAPATNLTTTDSPWYNFASNFVASVAASFDPWTTTSSSSVNLSSLSAGGSVSFQVPAGIPNITNGRQLRATHTGTSTDYVIFSVASYSGTTLTGTIISSAQGGYLGGPIGGTATVSAWTISAERIYQTTGGMVFYEGFSSTTQQITTCSFGLEGSFIADVKWPVGGNPAMTTQDRAFFQVPTNPFGASLGVVNGYSPVGGGGLTQAAYLDFSKNDSTFWVGSCEAEICFSTSSAKSGTFTAYTNQPLANDAGPIACATSNFVVVADRVNGIYYSQNGSTISATWTIMPSPAPTSGWSVGNSLFQMCSTLTADKTTITAPYLFYALNSDLHIYKFSVPTSGSPTVTQMGLVSSPAPGAKLESVLGNAGHLFYCPGEITTSNTYALFFSAHPSGGNSRLSFSSDGGNTWNFLTTTQEVLIFALGAAVSGGSGYPAIYICGWAGGGGYGVYQCINFNPASLGSETWTKINGTGIAAAFTLAMPYAMGADPNTPGRFIIGTTGSGAAIYENTSIANPWY
jgi:hypothetical protein